MLAMENRKMGLVSELPAVYLQTLSSDSSDSPPWLIIINIINYLLIINWPDMRRTCFSWGMPQLVCTACFRWWTFSRARPMSRVSMLPVSTRNMYNMVSQSVQLVSNLNTWLWRNLKTWRKLYFNNCAVTDNATFGNKSWLPHLYFLCFRRWLTVVCYGKCFILT